MGIATSAGIPSQECWLWFSISLHFALFAPCAVCSVAVDLKFDLLAVLRAVPRMRQAGSIISPQTVVTSESGSLESVAPVAGISCISRERHCTETTLFEQSRAVAGLRRVRSCLP